MTALIDIPAEALARGTTINDGAANIFAVAGETVKKNRKMRRAALDLVA